MFSRHFYLLLLAGCAQSFICPTDEKPYSRVSCLRIFDHVSLNYTNAKTFCIAQGGDLIYVGDARQAEIIRRYLESLNETRSVWIGRYYLDPASCYTADANTTSWKAAACSVETPFICLKTYEGSKLVTAPSEVRMYVVQNQTLTLAANVSGVGINGFEWIHGNGARAMGVVSSTNSSSSLTIKRIDTSVHLGYYSLVVNDMVGSSVIAVWEIRQASIPTFTIQPKSMNVSIANTVAFECATSTQPKAELAWYRNGALLTPSSRIHMSDLTGTLVIRNVTKSDEGSYYCKASNLAGAVTSYAAELEVVPSMSVQTYFVLQPRNTIVVSGNPFSLECIHSQADSSLTAIFTNDFTTFAVLSNEPYPTYIVPMASRGNSKNYTCQCLVAGAPPTVYLTPTISVQVQSGAEISSLAADINGTIVQTTGVLAVPSGTINALVCSYKANPPPTRVTWLINSLEVTLEASNTETHSVLSVSKLAAAGVYQCLVANEHGIDIASVLIDLQDTSDVPRSVNFTVTQDSTTQLLVQWLPSSPGNTTDPLLLRYEVLYSSALSGVQSSNLLHYQQREYLIIGLEVGTAYNVSVVAHTIEQKSSQSWVVISTHGRAPRQPVSNLAVQITDDMNIKVSWSPLITNPPEGPIHHYILSYQDDQGSNGSVMLEPSVTSFLFTSTAPGPQFEVCISCAVQVQSSPVKYESCPLTCTNAFQEAPPIGSIATEVSSNLAPSLVIGIITAVSITVVICILVFIIVVGLIRNKKRGKYSPARVERAKFKGDFNADRQRPMGQQVYDLAATLSMLDEAFNSLSNTVDLGVGTSKRTEASLHEQNHVALTPSSYKDEEML